LFSKVKLRWPHGLKAYVPKTTRYNFRLIG
jgi:hypothetical protein